ncbi:survival motor neuron protein-like isoform X2 [Synchiropus splendidus]|uniref:survival motor neuron protein-like isoform X2 n=1 Tax=Synchiropus splendidus TaxID=270530 RepID=UPI00237D32E1|nr:survival motor neuron protein-like isoform X2 [Synchiropus splendidus]
MSVATMDNVYRGNIKESFEPAEVDPTAPLIEPLKVLEIAQDAGRSDYSAVEKNDKGLEVQEDALSPSATASTSVHEWKAGSPCRAVFSEDGLVYPAVVMWVEGQRCRVRYDVYNNEEEVDIGSLLQPDELPGSNRAVKPASQGPIFRSTDWRRKRREENQSGGGERSSPVRSKVEKEKPKTAVLKPTNRDSPGFPQFPDLSHMTSGEPLTFTPPPPFGGKDPDSDTASNMMMMWYMLSSATSPAAATERGSIQPAVKLQTDGRWI